MKNLQTQHPIRREVLEEAAGWLVEFRAGDPSLTDRRGFDFWLRTSPEHVRAYLTLLPAWENEAFGQLESELGSEALIGRARAHARDRNVVPLLPPLPRPGERARVRGASRWLATAATLLLTLGVAGYFAFSLWRSPVYATGIGEHIAVSLPDATTVKLNSRTRIKLRYSQHERRIELEQGQALFQVAKDAQRPFIVSVGASQIRAIGTQFDIYKKRNGTVVTVVEGRVAVSTPSPTSLAGDGSGAGGEGNPKGQGPTPVLLSAGQQLTVDRDTAIKSPSESKTPARVNVKTATAWTQGRIIFSATPLTEVAEEFNRYNARQLIIDDALELKTFRINGVFSSADPAALLGFLREQPGIAITESGQEIHIFRE